MAKMNSQGASRCKETTILKFRFVAGYPKGLDGVNSGTTLDFLGLYIMASIMDFVGSVKAFVT